MKGQLAVSTTAEYIAALEEPRRSEIAALDALIRQTAPELDPVILSGMPAYGRFHYKYASGREGDSARVIVASNQNYISLYLGTGDRSVESIPERHKQSLPKAKVGRGCVRFKRLADVDRDVLQLMVREAAQSNP